MCSEIWVFRWRSSCRLIAEEKETKIYCNPSVCYLESCTCQTAFNYRRKTNPNRNHVRVLSFPATFSVRYWFNCAGSAMIGTRREIYDQLNRGRLNVITLAASLPSTAYTKFFMLFTESASFLISGTDNLLIYLLLRCLIASFLLRRRDAYISGDSLRLVRGARN